MVLVAIASIAVGMVIASRLDLSPTSDAQVKTAAPAMNNTPLSGPIDALTFRRIAQEEIPAVVNLRTIQKMKASEMTDSMGGDLLERFFGPGARPAPRQEAPEQEGTGTGFVIDAKDGLILTNNHVVENATTILVTPYGAAVGETYEADLVGRDLLTDSALVRLRKLPPKPLAQVRFGSADEMQPGDWVMAIGNPFEFAHTVTVGVISAVGRPFAVAEQRYQNVLQTDAAINPGNSGGPLLNLRGEVIGINTAIISNARTPTNIGIGFAIPINVVRDLLPQLRAGKVVRGRIGVTVQPVPPDSVKDFGLSSRQGAMVMSVASGGPADKAGVKPGDVVVEFNGQPVSNNDELVRLVTGTKPGATVPMKVMRDKQEKTLTITVAELNLEEESGRSGRGEGGEDNTAETGFGLTLDNLTPEMARRLRVPSGTTGALITEVDPGNTSTRGLLSPGDVILEINRAPVTSAAEAARALQKIPSGGRAYLLVWRQGQQVFVTVRKE